jgi:hypothetical protein
VHVVVVDERVPRAAAIAGERELDGELGRRRAALGALRLKPIGNSCSKNCDG